MSQITIGKINIGWVELVSIILLILGFITAMSALGSMVIFFIVAFLTGVLFGRVWYKTRKSLQFKYFIMTTFFLLGLLSAHVYKKFSSPEWTFILYIIGIVVSYHLHSKGLMEGIDF